MLQKLVSLAVPMSVALATFSSVHGIGAGVDVTAAPSSIAPFADARAGLRAARRSPTALFEHRSDPGAGLLAAATEREADPRAAPPCEGVRVVASVRADEPEASFAALDVAGARPLQKQRSAATGVHVVYVGADRVWLERDGALCQARVL
ncbi:MAG: hypothetical protein KF894_31635 [Labilithrix sp.]|nr:hypothetical protein [Labilithrix sp.]